MTTQRPGAVEAPFEKGIQDGGVGLWDPPSMPRERWAEDESAVQTAYLEGYSRGVFRARVGDPFQFLMSTAYDRGYADSAGGPGRRHGLPENFSDDLAEIEAVRAEYARGFQAGVRDRATASHRYRGVRGAFRKARNPYPEGPDPRGFLWVSEPPAAPARGRRLPPVNVCASEAAKYDWLRAEMCIHRGGGPPGPILSGALAVSDFIHDAFPDLAAAPQERFIVIALDGKNRAVGVAPVHAGSLSYTGVDPAQVFRYALMLPCRAIIVAHNHPSGDPQFSQDDLRVTSRLAQAALQLNLPLLDHVVITPDRAVFSSYTSVYGTPA